MKTTWLRAVSMSSVRILVAAGAALALLTGCPNPPRSGKLEKPVYSVLEIPKQTGGWTTYSSTPPMEVLPTRGRVLRVWFYAPLGSSFDVGLRAPDNTLTPLPQNHGAQLSSEQGFFQVINVNTARNPPLYTVHLRAPLTLVDPANFNIEVVNKSLRTDVTDSDSMIVRLAQRKVFTVSVAVTGNGHVTSNPPGIACGTSAQGRAMTQCSHDFGRGQVTLNPGSNDLNTTKFVGWSGNCAPNVQACALALTGMATMNATAIFGPRMTSLPVSNCPVAPAIAGLRWIDQPTCATGNIAEHPGISLACDAQGYFCCEPGTPDLTAPRCGGQGKILSSPDCRRHTPGGMLRQPGGCYEVDSGP